MIKKFSYALVGIIALAIFLAPFIIKVGVDCRSQYGECPAEIGSKLKTLNGNNLFLARNQVSKILGSDLLVSNFSTQFKVPNQLEVNLIIKKPTFGIIDKDSGNIGLVDLKGQIVTVTQSTALPLVSVSKEIKLGEILEARELFALNLIEDIYEMYQIRTGDIVDSSLVVELPGQIRVIFPLVGDKNIILGALRLTYAKIESSELAGQYKEIDLRFKNPVLR